MSYLYNSGSLTGSRVLSQHDFCASSQIAAMRPVLNTTAGPSLFLVSDFPYPKYKTIYPVSVKHGQEQTVSITFLSKDANNYTAKLLPIACVKGWCNTLLERIDLEVWKATLHITGDLLYGLNYSRSQVIMTLQGLGTTTEVEVEFDVTRDPPFYPPVVPSPVVVPVSVSSYGQNPYTTPIHRSLRSSYVPSSAIYNSRYADNLQASLPPAPVYTPAPIYTPGRYHSEYCYDGSKYIPEQVKQEVHNSYLSTSLRGSQINNPAQTNFHLPEPALNNEELNLSTSASKQVPVKEEEPENIVEENKSERNKIVSIKILPQSLTFAPCEPNQTQQAKAMIKNVSDDELTLKLQIANRSFATSTANCKYSQLNSDISMFQILEDGEQKTKTEQKLSPGAEIEIALIFCPKTSEYPICCAKLLIYIQKDEGYQIPLLGVNGIPQLTALEKNFLDVSRIQLDGAKELRIRNDGHAPAFVGFEADGVNPDITIIQPQGSETIQVKSDQQLKIRWGNDYLRCLADGALKQGPWQEMVDDLLVDVAQIEHLLEENTEIMTLEV